MLSKFQALTLIIGMFLAPGLAPAAWFERGDVDGSGTRNVVDPYLILRALFAADQVQLGCREAADVDDNGRIEVTDAIDLLQYLFVNGPRPWPETLLPGCWINESVDSLGCERSPACGSRGVIYVCDRSPSFTVGMFTRMRLVITRGIEQLSEDDQFAMLFFDAALIRFPSSGQPASATSALKSEATAFVNSITTGRGTCPKPGLLGALAYAEQSTAGEKSIVFITDGFATCPGSDMVTYQNQILSDLEERNTGGVRIDVIGADNGSMDEEWLRKIAEQNGGTFAILK